MQDGASDPTRPSVDVEHRPVSAPAFAAIVRLCGEHDIASASEIADALSAVFGDVLVDLSGCSFLDSSTIGVLLKDGQRRDREGQRLELLSPETSSPVSRTLEIMGVDRILATHHKLAGGHAGEPTDGKAA
jgi:anti-anti-sigma factor